MAGRAFGWVGLALTIYDLYEQASGYFLTSTLPGGWYIHCANLSVPDGNGFFVFHDWAYGSGAPPLTCVQYDVGNQAGPATAFKTPRPGTGAQYRVDYFVRFNPALGLNRWDPTRVIAKTAGATHSNWVHNIRLSPRQALNYAPWIAPGLTPAYEYMPIIAPVAPPRWITPHLNPLPLSPQTREAGPVPERKFDVHPNWRIDVRVRNDGRGAVRVKEKPDPNPNARNQPRRRDEKERKKDVPSRVRAALGRVAAGYSEANDFVESLWKALPAHVRRQYRWRSGTGPWVRARAVAENFDEIDWDKAIENLISNEIEDRLVGRSLGKIRDHLNSVDPSGSLWNGINWYY